jgi:hypothetical protein
MPSRTTVRSWTSAEIAKIRELAAKGAMLPRIAAALGRSESSVRVKAREEGIVILTMREYRQKVKDAERTD